MARLDTPPPPGPLLRLCSSEQSARVKTQKELMKALKEMKIRLPSEKRSKGKSGTLATLQYALSCVKQVQGRATAHGGWRWAQPPGCQQGPGTPGPALSSSPRPATASQDYYQQWAMDGSQPCTLDMSSYTMEELENITSEYTLKNPVSAPIPAHVDSLNMPGASLTPHFLRRTPSRWLCRS